MPPFIIVLAACTTVMHSYVSGVDDEHRAAYARVAECISLGTHADRPEEHLPVATDICDSFKAMYPCLTNPFNSDSNAEILDFYRAYQLQRVFLANKANMCGEPLDYLKLKELVRKSGIMERENLPSVEYDQYVPCEGEISMRCYTAANRAWVAHSSDLRMFLDFIECYGRETPTCDFRIARHMNTLIQAFGKHLKEKHGLLSGMLEKIKQ